MEITSLETQLFSLSTPLSTSILFDGRQKMNKYLGGFPRSYSLAWHYRPDPARRLIGGDEEVECLPKNLNVLQAYTIYACVVFFLFRANKRFSFFFNSRLLFRLQYFFLRTWIRAFPQKNERCLNVLLKETCV